MYQLAAQNHVMTFQEKRALMFALVEAWRESGMTQNEFASQHNITLSKFQYWVGKYKSIATGDGPAGFVQICSNDTPFSGSGNEIRLHYPNGMWLSLPCDTPVSVLKALVAF